MDEFLFHDVGTSLGAAAFNPRRHVAAERVGRQTTAGVDRLVPAKIDDERGRSPVHGVVGRRRGLVRGGLPGTARVVARRNVRGVGHGSR